MEKQIMKLLKGTSTAKITTLLSKVYLNGTIEQCLLLIRGGKAHIEAVDLTNTVLVVTNANIPDLEDGEYGLTQLGMIVKYLSNCKEGEEVSYSIEKGKQITFRRKGHGRIKFTLLEVDLIGTRLESSIDIEDSTNEYTHKVPLKANFIERALYYLSVADSQVVQFATRKGKLLFESIANDDWQFTVPVTAVKDGEDEGTLVKFYSEQMRNILTIVQPNDSTFIHLKKECPVIITEEKTNMWALTPLSV